MFRGSASRVATLVSRRYLFNNTPHRILPSLINPTKISNINRFQSTSNSNTTAQLKVDKPQLMIAFTCKKCDTRSSHVMSKQAYTSGTVLITCPGCKNRHLIADHLKIFSDDRITIQDILHAKGESISQNTDDLVFDEIPDKLKSLIGHHAKDSPDTQNEQNNKQDPKILPQLDEGKK